MFLGVYSRFMLSERAAFECVEYLRSALPLKPLVVAHAQWSAGESIESRAGIKLHYIVPTAYSRLGSQLIITTPSVSTIRAVEDGGVGITSEYMRLNCVNFKWAISQRNNRFFRSGEAIGFFTGDDCARVQDLDSYEISRVLSNPIAVNKMGVTRFLRAVTPRGDTPF